MKDIFITGSNGFVGKNVIKYFELKYEFNIFLRNDEIKINEEVVLHFAGKAHDLKNTSNPKEYYNVNTELTKKVFDAFLQSPSKVFITLSSVKAAADNIDDELTEDFIPNPITDYGKSKLLAEEYILSKNIPEGKRVYILRPCMIHGQGNKGNLNLLIELVRKGLPWPLGSFENKRSFCSVENLCFIIKEIIINETIPSGIYNIADDEPLSTNEIILLISKSLKKEIKILKIPVYIIKFIALLGDIFKLPLTTEKLNKLTCSYLVSNNKIKHYLKKELPVLGSKGLLNTIDSFKRL
jgi:nucleoside-diphosphate-sugar epimerase